MRLHRRRAILATLLTLLALLGGLPSRGAATFSATLPPGFEETVVLAGLEQPTAVRFANDGRIFVAEKSGLVKVFSDLADPAPTVVVDLRTNVHNYWDRGLLGLALHPDFPTVPDVYVLYTLDAAVGGTPPRWGVAGATTDGCPDPTGAGCVVGGRLARFEVGADGLAGPEHVLLEDWCQQFPSHSMGGLVFGPDGALYVGAGDGASFIYVDYGQGADGGVNACGDPTGGSGDTPTLPAAEGGALRSQDLLSSADPLGYDGAILRLDPLTGTALPDNPLVGGPPGADRVIAFGLRNPYRMTFRPGTSELWIGDVGWDTWEEIDRIPDVGAASVPNFGWPCYEGPARQPQYDDAGLARCEELYASPSAVTAPHFAYRKYQPVVPGESCATGSTAITGLAFYPGGSYPATYANALFFADYSRGCIWTMLPGADGLPDPATRATFAEGVAAPVALEIGPGGDLFYVDFNGGTVRRVRYTSTNTAPSAVITTPASGTRWRAGEPIAFAGSATDAEDGPLPPAALAWTLLVHHCAAACTIETAATASGVAAGSFVAPDPGDYPAYLELVLTATDAGGLSDTTQLQLDPETVTLGFVSSPPGLTLVAGPTSTAAPFVRTAIVGAALTLVAPGPQTLDGIAYLFASWSDGGARTHTITVPELDTSFTATFVTACAGDADCDDLNPCSEDRCDLLAGCEHTAVSDGASCDDGTVCNGTATCAGGACEPGPAPDCDDRNPCTLDACHPAGCAHTALPEGTSCGAGSTCGGSAACDAGICTAVPPLCEDFHVPGTQPGDVPPGALFEPSTCAACHGHYDPTSDPLARWSGSLMAHAGRDPLFFAQMTTANQDVPSVGYFCMRCHVPLSIVTGHANEPDGRLLDATDRDGVTCHFCHSMVDPRFLPGVSPPEDAAILAGLAEIPDAYGNAMFVLDPTGTRRGPRADPLAPHAWIASPFHATGEFCGTCHDVGNLAVTRAADGTYHYNAAGVASPTMDPVAQFPLERTYTEWRLSAFADHGVDMGGRYGGSGGGVVSTCQDCHMPRDSARACVYGNVRPDLARHDFAGAAAPVLDLIAAHTRLDPAVDQTALARGRAAAVTMLGRAASLTLAQDASVLSVRVTNESGHKLPTGHIEGRRIWIHVAFRDERGALLREHGRYDPITAELDEASTVVYEMHVGLSPAAAAVTGLPAGRTGHMALADTIEKDNRIPPRGFANEPYADAGAPVVAWTYADGQHWDDARFLVPVGATSAEVALRYQSTPRDYIDALRDNNRTDGWGVTLHDLWTETGRGAPITMATAALALAPPQCDDAAACDDGDACTVDACDPDGTCEHRFGGVPLGPKSSLVLGRLQEPDHTTLALRAEGAFAPPFDPALDPLANGLRLELRDGAGAFRERIVLPGGARDPVTGIGWTRNRRGTTWRYRAPRSAPGGIRWAIVRLRHDLPGSLRLALRGVDRPSPLAPGDATLTLRLAFGETPAQCGEIRFATAADPRPRCQWNATARTFVCR